MPFLPKRHADPGSVRRRGRFGVRYFAAGVVLFVLAGVVGAYSIWSHRAFNGVQGRIESLKAAGQPVLNEDFDCGEAAQGNNSAETYQHCLNLMNPFLADGRTVKKLVDDPQLLDASPKLARDFLVSNRPALDHLRLARNQTDFEDGIVWCSPLTEMRLPDLAGMRELGRITAVAALIENQSGRQNESIELVRDGLRLGDQLCQFNRNIIQHLVGLAIVGQACSTIEQLAPTLIVADPASIKLSGESCVDRSAVVMLINHLLEDGPLTEGWRTALHGERCVLIDVVDQLGLGVSDERGGSGKRKLKIWAAIWRPSFRDDLAYMLDVTTGLAEAGSAASYSRAVTAVPLPPPAAGTLDRYHRLLSSIFLPDFESALRVQFQTRATRRMAAIRLAMRLYELENGTQPESLDALIPTWLPAVPVDPFAPNGVAIRYRKSMPACLYSVGPNQSDELGEYAVRNSKALDLSKKDLPLFLDGTVRRHLAQQSKPAEDSAARSGPEVEANDEP